MFTKPWPSSATDGSNPAPSSATVKSRWRSSLGDRHRDARALAGVLARVLHRLEAAEVDRGLGLGRVALDSFGGDLGREHRPVRRGAQRLGEPAVAEQRRVDAVRELAQLGERRLHVAAQLLEHRHHGGRVGLDELAGQARPSPRARRGAAARRRAGCARSRRRDSSAAVTMRRREAWSCSLRSRRVSRLAWSAESSWTLCRASATWRASSVSTRSDSSVNGTASGGALGDDQAEQRPRVHDRRHAHDALTPVRDQPRDPDLQPRVARDAGAGSRPAAPRPRARAGAARGPAPRRPARARRRCRSRPRRSASCMLSFSDSASWSSSSSIGTERDMREPNVWIASSGERRSPYTRRRAISSRLRRAGSATTAARTAATIESPSSSRASSSGASPRPSTTRR